MELGTAGVIVAVFSFLGGVVGAALSNWVSAQLARDERREAQRRERFEFIKSIFDEFKAAYSEYLAANIRDGYPKIIISKLAECRVIPASVGDKILSDRAASIVGKEQVVIEEAYLSCLERFAELLSELSHQD